MVFLCVNVIIPASLMTRTEAACLRQADRKWRPARYKACRDVSIPASSFQRKLAYRT